MEAKLSKPLPMFVGGGFFWRAVRCQRFRADAASQFQAQVARSRAYGLFAVWRCADQRSLCQASPIALQGTSPPQAGKCP